MNVKYFYSFVALLLIATSVFGQEKKNADVWKRSTTVKAYKSAMKDKKYSVAKNEIDGALKKYAEAKADAQLYMFKCEAIGELIVAENRKIYLNQKPDTAQYFNLIYDLYESGLICDSLEQLSIAAKKELGKKAEPKFRNVVASKMMTYRKKMLTGGKFFYSKKDYKKAYQFFDIYSKTKSADVFSSKINKAEIEKEDDIIEVASLALLSAYASSNHRGVMSYLSDGLKNKMIEKNVLEIASKSAAALGDSLEMVNLLETGFNLYPETDYFFVNLTKYYNEHEMYEKALAKSAKMVVAVPNNRDYWFVKGKEEMLLEKNDSALVSFSKCVELKADDAESYSAIGNLHLLNAHELYAQFNLPRNHPDYNKKKNEINDAYRKACENFELAKKFDENKKELWIDGLREVYFKLNKGKELKSLDKYN